MSISNLTAHPVQQSYRYTRQRFVLIRSNTPTALHLLQMLQHRHVRVEEPLHAILCTGLLPAAKLAACYLSCNAFLPAYVCKVVDGLKRIR